MSNQLNASHLCSPKYLWMPENAICCLPPKWHVWELIGTKIVTICHHFRLQPQMMSCHPLFQLGSRGEHLSPFVTKRNSRHGNSAPPFPAPGASLSTSGPLRLTRSRRAWTRTNPRRATNWNSSRKPNSPLSSRSAAVSSTSGGLPASSRPSSWAGPSGSERRKCSLLWNGTRRPEVSAPGVRNMTGSEGICTFTLMEAKAGRVRRGRCCVCGWLPGWRIRW